MPTTLPAFFDELSRAAETLPEPALHTMIRTIHEQAKSPKLRILVVGEAGTGRFSLANAMVGHPTLFVPSPLPRPPLSIRIHYGDTTTVQAIAHDDTRLAMPHDKLHAFLTAQEQHVNPYHTLLLTTPADMLTTSDVRIETITAHRSSDEWHEIIANTDFAFVVLKAVALLSEHEKRFLRDILQPHFGFTRVAILINQMDLVEPAERAAILQQVRTFLGPFESQPLLLGISAAHALQGITSGDISAESGYPALRNLLQHDLIDQHRHLKTHAIRHAAELCLTSLEQQTQRHVTLLQAGENELQQLLDRLNRQETWVQQRIECTHHRIEAFVETIAKEQFLRDIEGFSAAFREQIADEIMAVDDITMIKRNMTGYIEALWREFFNYQLGLLRNRLADEMNHVRTLMIDDLKEYLGDSVISLQELVAAFDPVPTNLKTFIMPSRGNHQAGTVATWMQLGGLVFLVANVQISLGLIGVGQAIRMIFQRPIDSADKQAIARSVINASYELEAQIKHQVAAYFAHLTQTLNHAVTEHYTQGTAAIREMLAHDIAEHQARQAHQDAIYRLRDETIPALRQALAAIPPEPSGPTRRQGAL